MSIHCPLFLIAASVSLTIGHPSTMSTRSLQAADSQSKPDLPEMDRYSFVRRTLTQFELNFTTHANAKGEQDVFVPPVSAPKFQGKIVDVRVIPRRDRRGRANLVEYEVSYDVTDRISRDGQEVPTRTLVLWAEEGRKEMNLESAGAGLRTQKNNPRGLGSISDIRITRPGRYVVTIVVIGQELAGTWRLLDDFNGVVQVP